MNAADLADLLAEEQGLTKAAAKQAIEIVLAAIVDAAAEGDEVALAGFGKFKVTERAARQGRNPATGRRDQDRGVPEAVLHPSEGGEGRAEHEVQEAQQS